MSAERTRAAWAAMVVALVAGCGGGGGGGEEVPSPSNLHIDPTSGFSGNATAVVITGQNFLARPTGGGLDTVHHAWLGSTPLDGVTWLNVNTLHATVPKGLAAGTYTLRVRNAYGKEGTLANAFTVSTSAGGALAVTSVQLTPPSPNVGQDVAVAAVVRNAGGAAVRDVAGALTITSADGGAAQVKDGPTPATVASLEAGEETTLRWTITATGDGAIAVRVAASGQDVFSSLLVSDERTTDATVVLAAGLTTSAVASRATADVGQAVPVVLSVSNGAGRASAHITTITPSASGVAATCDAVTPTLPVDVAAASTVEFRWNCTATAAGTLTVGADVEGTDTNTGDPISDTASTDHATIQTAAALRATLAVAGHPTTVNVGQPLDVTVTVENTGQGTARITGLTAPSPAAAASCDAPSPPTPVDLAGGDTVAFTFSCQPQAQGALSLGAAIQATNLNRGTALPQATAAPAAMTVQYPAAPAALVSATPDTADVGQSVAVSFTVVAGGSATAGLTGVTVAPSVDGTGGATCGAASPATPQTIAAGGSRTFTWSCTVSAAGDLLLSGTAQGTDANSSLPVSATPTAPAAVTAQEPAELTVLAFTARAAATVGQQFPVSLTLRNVGGAPARITGVAPVPAAGSSGLGCSAATPPATPAGPQVLAGGAQIVFDWTCTGTAAGRYTLRATVTATDANWTAVNPAAGVAPTSPLQIETAAALSVDAFSATRSTANVGQATTVTLRVRNTGGATAEVTGVAPTWTPEGSADLSCGAVDPPATPGATVAVAGGQTATFTWACTGAAAGDFTLGADVSAADANDGASADVGASGLALAVQTAAQLTGALGLSAASALVGEDVTVTLTLDDGGGGAARVDAVAPVVRSGEGSCDAASPASLTVPGGGQRTSAWLCRGTAAGDLVLGVAVTAVDANDPAIDLSPAVGDVTLTVSEPPPP